MFDLGNSPYGREPAAQFGPLAIKAHRERMIVEGLGRVTTNKKVDVIKRAFKWAAGEETISAEVYHALRVVEGLKKGRTVAHETKPVLPVGDDRIQATLPHLPEIIADMVRLQRLTGMRPAEVCITRPCDIDRGIDVWSYRPAHHKTEHHGRERVVILGPQAQALLRPYLLRDEATYCFVPQESEGKRRALQHAQRITSMKVGNRPGSNRKQDPKWAPGVGCYTTDAYPWCRLNGIAEMQAMQRA